MRRIGTVKGAGQRGCRLATSKLRSAIPMGSIVTIEGISGISRMTRRPYSGPRQFVVTSPAVPGDVCLNIYPPLEPDGDYQTVMQSPRNRAQILMVTFDAAPEARWT